MKKYICLWILFMVVVFGGCYDDKGNYDYIAINSVEITGIDITSERSPMYVGDEITFTPRLSFALDSTASNFKYEWEFWGEVVGTERELHWIADTAGNFASGSSTLGGSSLVFTMTDTILDISYVYSDMHMWIWNSGAIENVGWLILSEVNGTSRVSLIQDVYNYDESTDEREYSPIVDLDVYAKYNNGESLGGKPLGLANFWTEPTNPMENPIHEVLILQEGGIGPIYVEGDNFSKSLPLAEEFFGGGLPAGVTFVDALDKVHTSALYTSDGQVYLRVKENPELIFSGKFDEPLSINGGMRITHWAAVNSFSGRVALLFDAANNRFLALYYITNQNDDYLTNGAIREVAENANLTTTSLRDMGDVEMLHVGAYSEFGMSYYLLVYRDNNLESDNYGRICAQNIMFDQDYSSMGFDIVYKVSPRWERPFPGENLLSENTVFATVKNNISMLLFSGGVNNSVLYAWSFAGTGTVAPKEVFDFEGVAIKHMCVQSQGNNTLVALEDGSVYQFAISEQILSEGGIKENTWWYKYEENFGDICSILRFPQYSADW